MRTTLITALMMLLGCTDKDEISVPGGTSQTGENQTNNNENTSSFDCPDEWTDQGGFVIDPGSCLAWSPPEIDIDWYEAVNQSQAEDGGCADYCDNNTEVNYCADLNLGGISTWRLPSIDELEDISLSAPPLEDIELDLWSYDSDTFDGMAWTANLFQAGMFFTLEKDTLAAVRCVAE